jgi:phosphoglycerate dehydrogenase-like enzyme
VFATEPLAETSALWSMPTVIVTPHSSGASNRTGERAAAIFIDLLGRHAAGDELTPAR